MVLFSICQRQTFSQNLPLLLLCFWLSLTPVILCFFFKKFFSFLLFVCFLLLFLLFASNTGKEQREEKFKCFRSSIYSLSHTALAYHTSDGDPSHIGAQSLQTKERKTICCGVVWFSLVTSPKPAKKYQLRCDKFYAR